jgi:hypothetical protein
VASSSAGRERRERRTRDDGPHTKPALSYEFPGTPQHAATAAAPPSLLRDRVEEEVQSMEL